MYFDHEFTDWLILLLDSVYVSECVCLNVCVRARAFDTVVQQCETDQGFLPFIDSKYITVLCILLKKVHKATFKKCKKAIFLEFRDCLMFVTQKNE